MAECSHKYQCIPDMFNDVMYAQYTMNCPLLLHDLTKRPIKVITNLIKCLLKKAWVTFVIQTLGYDWVRLGIMGSFSTIDKLFNFKSEDYCTLLDFFC